MKYEILDFSMIETRLLSPHPDALAYPSDEDDRASLDASIEGVGVLEPLAVVPAGKGWLVIDGCGRLEDALRRGTVALPCLTVSCDSPREFAAHKNAMGRKRSTGSRVLCYLMANIKAVIEAAEAVQSHDRTGKMQELPPRLKPWTTREIARRLKVSDKDVVLAVQLAVCQTQGVDPDDAALDEAARESLDAVFTSVMCARTPVRRWKAALGGKRVPAEGCGKAATDHRALALRTVASLRTVFAGWYGIPAGSREFVLGELENVLAAAPEEARVRMAAALAPADAKAGRGKTRS